jgi:chemotaxis response regulator CheB
VLRVFILSTNRLLGQGVVSLLQHESEVEIVGQESDVDLAIERIKHLLPDAVLVASTEFVADSASVITRVLDTAVSTNVIGLNLTENKLHLYYEEQREARGIQDLVDAMRKSKSASVVASPT